MNNEGIVERVKRTINLMWEKLWSFKVFMLEEEKKNIDAVGSLLKVCEQRWQTFKIWPNDQIF